MIVPGYARFQRARLEAAINWNTTDHFAEDGLRFQRAGDDGCLCLRCVSWMNLRPVRRALGSRARWKRAYPGHGFASTQFLPTPMSTTSGTARG